MRRFLGLVKKKQTIQCQDILTKLVFSSGKWSNIVQFNLLIDNQQPEIDMDLIQCLCKIIENQQE